MQKGSPAQLKWGREVPAVLEETVWGSGEMDEMFNLSLLLQRKNF